MILLKIIIGNIEEFLDISIKILIGSTRRTFSIFIIEYK